MLLPWEDDLLPESLTIFSFLSGGSKCLLASLGLLPLNFEPCSPSPLLWLLCFLPLRSLRLPEASVLVRFFSDLEVPPPLDDRGLLELVFDDVDFFFSPSFLTLDAGVTCDICGGSARMLLAVAEEGTSNGTDVAGDDDSMADAAIGTGVGDGDPDAGPDDRGATDDKQFGGGDTAPLPGSNAGCEAVVPFSRTSQFLTGCNIFDEVVSK